MQVLLRHQNELEEDFRSKDLLKWDNQIIDYSINKLDTIQKSGIVGLVGPFGCGKTTFINQIIARESGIDSGSKWLKFDAWKYPDRKDLRENFILDIAQQMPENLEKCFLKKIKGKPDNFLGAIVKDGINYVTEYIPNVREYIFNREKRELKMIEDFLKEIFLTIHIGENGRQYKTIFIVIEDIDRSGDAGVYFLQTLNYFLKNINLGEELKVIAIATIGNIEYRGHLDSYLKCIDYVHNFPAVNYDYKPMINYFMDARCYNDSLIDFINYISKHYCGFTPRTLKHILRDLSIAFIEFDIANSMETLLRKSLVLFPIITAKYINVQNKEMTIIDLRRQKGKIEESVFKSFILSIIAEKPFLIQNERGTLDFLNPDSYNEVVLDYVFTDFGDDDSLIAIQRNTGTSNATIYIDNRLLLV